MVPHAQGSPGRAEDLPPPSPDPVLPPERRRGRHRKPEAAHTVPSPRVSGDPQHARPGGEVGGHGAQGAVRSSLAYDVALVEEIREFGFESPAGRQLEQTVVVYGLGVVRSWVASGLIWKHTQAAVGYRGSSCWNDEEAVALVHDTVIVAWRRFKKNILAGDWDPTKSNLRTSFLNKCKIAFVEEYGKWRDRSRPDALEILVPMGSEEHDSYGGTVRSAEDEVVERDWIRRAMGSMPVRTARIVAMHTEGYTHKEIATYEDSTPKSVEGVLGRWRENPRGGETNE